MFLFDLREVSLYVRRLMLSQEVREEKPCECVSKENQQMSHK